MTAGLDLQTLRTYLRTHHGALSTGGARLDLGLAADDLARLTRAGVLVQVCRGGYADARAMAGATPEAVHELRLRAVLAAHPRYAASHLSAAVLFGLPLIAADLGRVHVVRRSGRGHGRRRSAYTVHEGRPEEFGTLRGAATVGPVDAVLGALSIGSDLSAQAVADAALRAGLATRELLRERAAGWGPRVRHAVEQADPGAESLGESGLRLVLRLLGYEVRTQVEFRDADGLVGRVDAYLPELGVVLEFDGAVKYAGADGREALVREKRREDRLRALGLAVVRIVWSDLRDPERIRRMVEQAARTVRHLADR